MAFACMFIFLLFKVTSCAVLLWSSKDIKIPALIEFDNDDFKNLVQETGNPQLITFSSRTFNAAHGFKELLINDTTTYIPNAKLTFNDVQELSGNDDEDNEIIEHILKPSSRISNKIVVLLIQDGEIRTKRSVDPFSSSTTESNDVSYLEPITGPILYSAVLPTDETVEAMIYSSRPPLLKLNGTVIILGKATVSNMDIRDAYTRLIATIPFDNGKISLRFKFYWISGYWYINSVEVEIVGSEITQYNLTLNQELTAPRRFSYHCGGTAIFMVNETELHLFDVQAQPDAHNHRFGDAYNCVPFTTGPIWSGIFVTFILCIGLLVGLTALNNIKTMDKFDNHKTKQLSITVWE